VVDGIQFEHGTVSIKAKPVEREVGRPACAAASSRVQSVYEQGLADNRAASITELVIHLAEIVEYQWSRSRPSIICGVPHEDF
jgi:hypothetical protein